MTPMTEQVVARETAGMDPEWIYLKLYLGNAVDRMDRFLIDIGRVVDATRRADSWFFIRYVDENGIHVRLRAKPATADTHSLRRDLINACAQRLSSLHELPAGDYFPMVTAPGFEAAVAQMTSAHNDVKVVEDRYEPELDKYGGPAGMPIAERLFAQSSLVACQVLNDEEHGLYSRKDLVPMLMDAVFRAFLPQTDQRVFWREYSYYWLGGKSPAADDWREKFFSKDRELNEAGIPLLRADAELPAEAARHLQSWRTALGEAAAAYRELEDREDVNEEVLCFNFAHLMNNRLGLAALEEAYMAALLERRATH
jgi:thiopeptide-type bacteriocin biosynthesis protein